jgi:hypothetical protein
MSEELTQFDCSIYEQLGECLKGSTISELQKMSKVDLYASLCSKCSDAFLEVETINCDGEPISRSVSLRELRAFLDPLPVGHTYIDYMCGGDRPEQGYLKIDDREITRKEYPDFFAFLDTSERGDLRTRQTINLQEIVHPGRIPTNVGGDLNLTPGELRGDADGTFTIGCENLPDCPLTTEVNHDLTLTQKSVDDDSTPHGPNYDVFDMGDETRADRVTRQQPVDGEINVDTKLEVGIDGNGNPRAVDILPPVQGVCTMIKVTNSLICT